jgi:hypothetical protein
MVCDEGM